MRKTLTWLAFITPCACGGRTLGEWPEQASGVGGFASGVTSGGGSIPLATGGVSSGSGGRSGGVGGVSFAGAPASGGVSAGGNASGGYASGGAPLAGSGGSEQCFEATQPGKDFCIHVRLCSAAQYETLCLMDTPSSAVCFCYINGEVRSAKSILRATPDALCEPAVVAECP